LAAYDAFVYCENEDTGIYTLFLWYMDLSRIVGNKAIRLQTQIEIKYIRLGYYEQSTYF